MAPDAHPPLPGPIVQPNILPVMEALATIEFPITKSQLMSEVEDQTVVINGRNVDLSDIIREVPDDSFASEDELAAAVEILYTSPDGPTIEGGVLPGSPRRSQDDIEP